MPKKLTSFILAFICYLPTLVNVPLTYVYLLISLLGGVFFLKKWGKKQVLKSDYFLILFLFITLIVYFAGDGIRESVIGKSKNDFVPYTFFLATTIFFARSLNNQVLKYLLYFILFEVFIGMLEYILGLPYFIKPLTASQMEFGSTDILYYNKVYGLSAVTSVFAQKVMIGILILYFLQIKKYKYIFLGALIVGLIITFNRTAIVASLFFLGMQAWKYIKHIKWGYKFLVFFIGIGLSVVILNNTELIVSQFFRGKSEVDYSGRDIIFESFLNFIKENLLFGNFVEKVWMEISVGRIYHAHNSYLETLASLGLLLSILLLIYFVKIIKRKSLIFILPILLYSIFQYGILWGVSFLDIVFFYIIFSYHKKYISPNHKTRTVQQ